jgi:hypothetical protein
MTGKHFFVKWAIFVIEKFVTEKIVVEPDMSLEDQLLNQKKGCFVTLHKLNDELRGCIGTIEPFEKNLALEIRNNAISASSRDTRFEPLREYELDAIYVTVDVLSPLEKIKSLEELNPKKYGVVISQGYRKGVLLPDLEGIEDVENQIRIAKMKAGIYNDKEIDIFRFSSKRYF